MHELSVCQALLTQVADIARAQGAEAVEYVTIEVGPLSGTEPDLLRSAFSVMRSGSVAAAKLIIKSCPVEISCLHCGVTTETQPNRLICVHCGGWQTRVVGGAELRLLRVAMRMPESHQQLGANPTEEQAGYV